MAAGTSYEFLRDDSGSAHSSGWRALERRPPRYGRSGVNGEVPGHPEVSCLCLIPIRARGRILLRAICLMLQIRLA